MYLLFLYDAARLILRSRREARERARDKTRFTRARARPSCKKRREKKNGKKSESTRYIPIGRLALRAYVASEELANSVFLSLAVGSKRNDNREELDSPVSFKILPGSSPQIVDHFNASSLPGLSTPAETSVVKDPRRPPDEEENWIA